MKKQENIRIGKKILWSSVLAFILLYFLTSFSCMAQDLQTLDEPIRQNLAHFQKILPFHLAYSEQILAGENKVSFSIDTSKHWKENLKVIQESLQVHFRISGDQLILFPKKKFLIQGHIYDEATGESLPGAHIVLIQNQLGVASNESGYYQLLAPEGSVTVQVSYLGYQPQIQNFRIQSTQQIDYKLKPALDLPEIIVREDFTTNNSPVYQTQEQIPLEHLHDLPSMGPTMDVTRYLQLSPGVHTGGDGFGGMHVRGGNADQNLILLEDIPIYNPFHLFGISSIFNGDAIQEAEFSKSYFAPSLDGRLSSALQVTIRDGNRHKPGVHASVGLLGSTLMIETPILKKTGTLMLAGQRSHAGNLLKTYSKRVRAAIDNDGYFKPKFWDLYGKAFLTLGPSDKLIFNFYTGADTHLDINRYPFENPGDTAYLDQYQDEYAWGNIAAGIKWLHQISGQAFLKITGYHSRYRYQSINAYVEEKSFNQQNFNGINELTEFRSSIQETGIKAALSLLTGYQHQLQVGLSLSRHNYVPGIIGYGDDETRLPGVSIGKPLPQLPDTLFDALAFQSTQGILHLEDQWDLTQRWKMRFGVNAILFNSGKNIFASIQPRFNITYSIKSHLLGFSFNKLYQPQHLITANDNGLPNELWVPATKKIKPQKSWNTDLSWTYQITGRSFIRSNIYFKKMLGLVSFRDEPGYLTYGPLDNVDASVWENDIVTGDGESWGIENSFQQNWQKFSLNLNYTFIRSSRFFEMKNLGYAVPYEFEIPHTGNIIGMWKINESWKLGGTFQISSGTRYNLIPGRYELYDQEGSFLEEFDVQDGTIDLLIMPVYHRLDLSVSYECMQRNRDHHQFKISLLNLYARSNIVFPRIYRGEPSEIRFSEGLPFIPMISYHFSL